MRRLRVLHVDDDPETLILVRMILEGEPDLDVLSCGSAAEARAVAAATSLDLLLIDVMMPGTDGPTLLAELRTWPALTTVPALFVTAKTHPSDLAALAATSAIGVVRKPFEAAALVEQVRGCLMATPT